MDFYNLKETAMRIYKGVRGALGDHSSLIRIFPPSWIEDHPASQRQRTENNWLKTQLEEAVGYVGEVRNDAGNAIQRRDYTIAALEAQVQARGEQIRALEAKAETAEKQYKAAQHWKRDVAEAGQALLKTRAEFEALKNRKRIVFAADHNDRTVYVSPEALEFLGYKDPTQIERRNVYDLLKGTGSRTTGQIKSIVQTQIMRDRPEKVSLPDALLIRSENRNPVGANLTILPIFAGTTYIGSVIRGESPEEKKSRIAAKNAEERAREAAERQERESQVAESHGIIAEALELLKHLRPNNS